MLNSNKFSIFCRNCHHITFYSKSDALVKISNDQWLFLNSWDVEVIISWMCYSKIWSCTSENFPRTCRMSNHKQWGCSTTLLVFFSKIWETGNLRLDSENKEWYKQEYRLTLRPSTISILDCHWKILKSICEENISREPFFINTTHYSLNKYNAYDYN